MSGTAIISVHSWRQAAAVTLAAGGLQAVFLPEVGLLGGSLLWQGHQLLSLHGGLAAYRRGNTTGLPLLYPWANRLSSRQYVSGKVAVDLQGLGLHTDDQGLPMHGTLAARPEWQLVELTARHGVAYLRARFNFAAHDDLLASFPFPHTLFVELLVDGALTVTTTVCPTSDRSVPVAFGWHPYFHLPRARAASLRLGLPERTHLKLDSHGIPNGQLEHQPAENDPLDARSFDDLYRFETERHLTLTGGGHRLTLVCDVGYRAAQIYTPPYKPLAVCLEPLTSVTNGLVSGNCHLVAPGDTFSASFTVSCQRH